MARNSCEKIAWPKQMSIYQVILGGIQDKIGLAISWWNMIACHEIKHPIERFLSCCSKPNLFGHSSFGVGSMTTSDLLFPFKGPAEALPKTNSSWILKSIPLSNFVWILLEKWHSSSNRQKSWAKNEINNSSHSIQLTKPRCQIRTPTHVEQHFGTVRLRSWEALFKVVF